MSAGSAKDCINVQKTPLAVVVPRRLPSGLEASRGCHCAQRRQGVPLLLRRPCVQRPEFGVLPAILSPALEPFRIRQIDDR